MSKIENHAENRDENRENFTPQPKRWYYGWTIVIAAALLTMFTVGMRMSIGPFVIPMSEGLGMSRSTLSAVIAFGMLIYGFGMPVAGFCVNRYGTRTTLILGAIMVSISLILTVYSHNIWIFALSYGGLLSFGLAFTSPVAFTQLISSWFIAKRTMALLFLSTGSMAGIAILTPLFSQTIQSFSWESTLIGYAILFTIATLFVAFAIIRGTPPQYGDLITESEIKAHQAKIAARNKVMKGESYRLREVFSTQPFWLLVIGIFACGFSMSLLGTHAVPMLIDHGFSRDVSAFGVSLIGLVAIFSTVMLGRISTHVDHKYMLVAIYAVRGVAFFLLVMVLAPWQLYTVAIVGGLVWAGNMGISSGMLADIYGVKLVGILYGLAFIGHQIGGTLSSWLGGWAYETYGSHYITFWLAGFFLIVAAIASMMLPKKAQYESSIAKIAR